MSNEKKTRYDDEAPAKAPMMRMIMAVHAEDDRVDASDRASAEGSREAPTETATTQPGR